MSSVNNNKSSEGFSYMPLCYTSRVNIADNNSANKYVVVKRYDTVEFDSAEEADCYLLQCSMINPDLSEFGLAEDDD